LFTLTTIRVILFHRGYQRLLENASGRENILWYNRRLRELGEEYYEEVRRIRVELEDHSAVHRRRCMALRKTSQPR
jgi:hypothetical protein